MNGEMWEDGDDDYIGTTYIVPTPGTDFVRGFFWGLGIASGIVAITLVTLIVRALVLFLV